LRVGGAPNTEADDVLQVIPQRKPPLAVSSVPALGADATGGRGTPPEGAVVSTRDLELPARRRRLGSIVFAAIGACGAILVAAGIARVARSADKTTQSDTITPPPVTAAAAAGPAVAGLPSAGTGPTPASPAAPVVGTLHIDRPAVPGRVWVDGKKLTATSAVLSCGQHQIRLGARGRAHPIDVPCGGDLHVSR
jgi:hypothetical protein